MDTDSNLSYSHTFPNDARSSGHDPDVPTDATAVYLQNQRREAYHKDFMDAVSFVNDIKAQVEDKPHIYRTWRDVSDDHREGIIDTLEYIRRVLGLFWEYDGILRRFNSYWPQGYNVEFTNDAVHTMSSIDITTPNGTVTYSASQIHQRYLVPPVWTASIPSRPQPSGAASSAAESTKAYEAYAFTVSESGGNCLAFVTDCPELNCIIKYEHDDGRLLWTRSMNTVGMYNLRGQK